MCLIWCDLGIDREIDMKKLMYLLTDRPYGNAKPCAYCFSNGYYVYQVYRENERSCDEKLFVTAKEAVDTLVRIKKGVNKCPSIN